MECIYSIEFEAQRMWLVVRNLCATMTICCRTGNRAMIRLLTETSQFWAFWLITGKENRNTTPGLSIVSEWVVSEVIFVKVSIFAGSRCKLAVL